MNDNIKTPRLKNLETYMLTHNRSNTYKVLLYSDLNKAQIYKMPCRDSPQREVEILMSFDYLNVFKPNENFLSKIEDKNIFMWEKNYLVLKQMMKSKNILQNMVLMILNSHLLTVKKTFISCYTKNIFLFKNMIIQH